MWRLDVPYKIFCLVSIFKIKYLLQHRCRTIWSCWHKALLSSSGPDSIEKDSWLACRADCSRQWQARLHTVGFGLAEGQSPYCKPMCGVAEGRFSDISTPNTLQTTNLPLLFTNSHTVAVGQLGAVQSGLPKKMRARLNGKRLSIGPRVGS